MNRRNKIIEVKYSDILNTKGKEIKQGTLVTFKKRFKNITKTNESI